MKIIFLGFVAFGVFNSTFAAESIDSYAAKMIQPSKLKLETKQSSKEIGADCTEVSEQRPSSELSSYNPNGGVLWPGALIQYKSLETGVLSEIPENRRSPITVYVTDAVALRPKPGMPPLTPQIRKNVATVSGNEVSQALVELLQQQFFTPPNFVYEIKESHSVEQSLLELGIEAHWMTGSVRSSLTSSDYTNRSNFIVRLTQAFYTVAVDPPRTPGDWFYKGVFGVPYFNGAAVDNLKKFSNPEDNPITFIRSVTYGRQAFLSISSSEEASKTNAAIQAAMNWATSGGSFSLDETHAKVLRESEIKVWVYGGGWQNVTYDPATGGATKAVDVKGNLNELLKYLQVSGKEDIVWARPLSYRADFIGSNTPAAVNMATTYKVCHPSPRGQDLGVAFIVYNGGGDDKDDDSTIDLHIVSRAGREFAKAEGIGRGENWDNNGQTRGAFAMQITQPITREDANAGLQLKVCMSNGSNDTFKYHLRFAGNVARPRVTGAPAKSWTAGWDNQVIHENSCNVYDLPTFPSGI